MLAVYKKELRSSIYGMTGPIFICAVLAIIGFFTARYQFTGGYSQFEFSVVDGAFWSLLLTPVLTMRSFSEERRTKTDQLLYSLPISTFDIVIGKYLALVTVFIVPCVFFCAYPAVIAAFTTSAPNFALAYGAIGAYFLLGCCVIAIGIFISSLFESQVICAIVNLGLILALYFLRSVASSIPESAVFSLALLIVLAIACGAVVYYTVKNVIAAVCTGGVLAVAAVVVYIVNSSLYVGLGAKMISSVFIFSPITAFANGSFDITCFIYYFSLAALFVFFTVQSFEKKRWN